MTYYGIKFFDSNGDLVYISELIYRDRGRAIKWADKAMQETGCPGYEVVVFTTIDEHSQD